MFVFMQLGIPVVADITPSNLHILGDPSCGFAVMSGKGWLNAFLKLKDPRVRQEIASNAYEEFIRKYDCKKWAINLIKGVESCKIK
jgi:glycosyltransferase involved in cell wall biosynthesis